MNTISPTSRMIWVTVLAMGLLYACPDTDSGGGNTTSTPTPTPAPTLQAGDITYASIAQGTVDISKPTSETLTDLSGLTFSLALIGTYHGGEVQERPTMVEDGTVTTTITTTAGSYRVTITPDGTKILGKPITADFYVTVKPADIKELDRMLEQAITAYGLTGDFNYIDTSAITTMSLLFAPGYTPNAKGIPDTTRTYVNGFNGDISRWDVSAVKNFFAVFFKATAFNQDIGNWEVSNGTTFEGMFGKATAFNQDISRWNVANSENFYAMFAEAAAFNQDLSRWKVDPTDNTTDIFKNSGVTTLPAWYTQ